MYRSRPSMYWTVSHGTGETIRVAEGYLAARGADLHRVLPHSAWQTLARLFPPADSYDRLIVGPADAGHIATVLRAVGPGLVPDRITLLARLADAAEQAAQAREPWHWARA
jgi:hypothetical protein